jgi:hypothetical protein
MSSPEDFELEAKREDLRDRRWRRHRSKLLAAATCFLAGLGLHAANVLVLLHKL